jgi:hypothetical protein
MTKEKLHWLIAIEVGLIILSIKMRWFAVDQVGLDPYLSEWIISEGQRGLSEPERIIGLSAMAYWLLTIISWLWLWNFKPYSRTLYTLMVFLGFVFYPLVGAYVSNGWVEMVEGFALIVSGMILGVLYFTDVYPKKSLQRVDE